MIGKRLRPTNRSYLTQDPTNRESADRERATSAPGPLLTGVHGGLIDAIRG
jgi:hypothetical protein